MSTSAASASPAGSRRRHPPAVSTPLIPVLAVIGVGLIGGSFAAGLRQVSEVGRVLGVDRDTDTLERALALKLIDEAVTLPEAARRADLILLATPVGALPEILTELAPHLGPNTVITDGGSTKQDVVAAASQSLGKARTRFVPGHPVAGSEKGGPDAARSDLYLRRRVILTPLADTDPDVIRRVRKAWQACGANVVEMDAERHDRLMASVSHLPHVVAFAYMTQLGAADDVDQRLASAGSGFRDFSRIAAASPEMWRDILLANRAAIRAELHELQDRLQQFDALLESADGEALEGLVADAAQLRRSWRL